MTTLIDISTELLALNDALDALDGDSEQQTEELYAWFTELLEDATEARNRKLDNYAALITELEARAEIRKQEAKRLADRARVDSNRAASLKMMLQEFFACHDLKSVETARYKLTLASNGFVLDLPDEYLEWSAEPDRAKIRAALEAGEVLTFARLGERGQSMRIK